MCDFSFFIVRVSFYRQSFKYKGKDDAMFGTNFTKETKILFLRDFHFYESKVAIIIVFLLSFKIKKSLSYKLICINKQTECVTNKLNRLYKEIIRKFTGFY